MLSFVQNIYNSKYKALPLPVRAVFWFTVCNFILKGLGFFSAPIFTRLIPEDEYGQLTIMYSYESLILTFSTWDIHTGAYARGYFKYINDINFFTNSTVVLINILTLIVFVLLFSFHNLISKYSGISFDNLILLFVYSISFPAYHMWLVRKRSEFAYKSVVLVTFSYASIGILIGILAVYFISPTSEVRYAAGLICSLAFCIWFYFSSISPKSLFIKLSEVKCQWRYCLRYQGPLLLHSLSFLILSQADRVMIGEMIGKPQAAFYSVAYNLAMAIMIFQTSMEQSLQPWRLIKMEEKSYGKIGSSTNLLLVVIGSIILLFVLISPELMKLLFTSDYYEAVWSIPPVAASVFFICLYNIFVNIETYFEKTIYVMLISIFCGIVNIILNYICINMFGYISCGYTTLISYVLFGILHYIVMKRICAKELPNVSIFCGNKIFVISTLFVVLCISVVLLYNYYYIRYGIMILILSVIFYKRNQLTPIISILRKK